MIFVGVDWAEAHHDVCVLDSEGRVLVRDLSGGNVSRLYFTGT